MPPAVYRYVQRSSLAYDVEEHLTSSLTIMQWQYDNDGTCHEQRNGGSCMAIYLGMAMEMP